MKRMICPDCGADIPADGACWYCENAPPEIIQIPHSMQHLFFDWRLTVEIPDRRWTVRFKELLYGIISAVGHFISRWLSRRYREAGGDEDWKVTTPVEKEAADE